LVVAESVQQHIKVSISHGGCRAFVALDGPIDDTSISDEDIIHLLQSKGVVIGVKKELLSALKNNSHFNEPMLVAEGIEPVAGKDGWVEYLVNTKLTEPMEEKGGLVDLHNLHRIHNVQKGQKLALIHLPQPGTAGMSVSGTPIPLKPGKKGVVFLGSYTALDPQDPNTIVATEDGNFVAMPDGKVEVQPVLTIRGDVDFSTGDIDFIGSVVITGDIKSDFSVKVKKKLEVHGNVEDANVQAGGDVIVKQGFFGRGKGMITSGGSVKVAHILNQSIICEKDITVEREAVCATLKAGGKVASSRAKFVGCTIEGGNEVEVLNLGNGEQTQAKVYVGQRAQLVENYKSIEKELEQLEKQLAEVRNGVYKLVRIQLDGNISDEQKQLLATLKQMQNDLPHTITILQKKKTDANVAIHTTSAARIIVRGTVFVNVLLEINGVRKLVQSGLKEVMFVENNGKIEELSAPSS